jgi:uncharacterized protein (DUF58 family)
MRVWRRVRAAVRKIRERFQWDEIRRLEVSRSGKWYIALTIALGVTALASGNNAIYLIESLLLAGLIHSGIQSEKQVSSVRVEFIRLQAKAREPTADWIVVHNEEKRTLFCLEIGEWKNGTFRTLAFFPKIKGKESARVRSQQEIPIRGTYRWDGFAVATSYPFGFAKKIKVVRERGERVIWPTPIPLRSKDRNDPNGQIGNRNPEMDIVEGEIRKYDWTDDARMIVANQSARGLGPMVRNRRPVLKEPEIVLDIRKESGEAFEIAVRKASSHFYQAENADLILVNGQGRKKILGKVASLTALALVEPDRSGK